MRSRLLLAVTVLFAASAAPAAAAGHDGVFIVELTAPPLAAYDGGTEGIPATSPRATRRGFDARSSAATRYRAFLAAEQSDALARVPGPAPEVVYSYRNALAGFAAALTPRQVTELEAAPEVARVTPATDDRLDTADDDLGGSNPAAPWLGGDGAAWLRLTAPATGATSVPGGGLWSRIGGGPTAADGPGDGTIVGDLDSGLTTANASFAATPAGGYSGAPFPVAPARWRGACDPAFGACSNKVIGARMFSAGLAASLPLAADELPVTPIDRDGHGSHTASTVAGNYGVSTGVGPGSPRISGMAPRARLAVYKVCWHTVAAPVGGTCNSADVVAAVDAGLADGVDVLTHSIGGPAAQDTPKQRAFLRAYDAGVFVAASAGNDGPNASTYGATPSPWTTVVAASTTNRSFAGRVTIKRTGVADLVLDGASRTGGLTTPTPLVDAQTVGATGKPASDVRLCFAGALDPAKVAGKVVFCERGTNGRLEKSAEVKRAGGIGMVLGNPSNQSLVAEAHAVPTVHVQVDGFTAIRNAFTAAGAQPLTITMTNSREAAVPADGAVPRVASFSSRGPVKTALDLPGPDLTAPGVAVLAAVDGTSQFDLLDGTSMATPHVAGLALLLRQRHPSWTPEAIKSALSTTADPNVGPTTGAGRADAQAVGSGQPVPGRADDPGLVLVPTRASLAAYGQTPEETAGDLNLPAVIAWEMGGAKRVTRRFTSVDPIAHRWTISGTAPGGGAATLTTTPALGETVTIEPCQGLDLTIDLRIGTGALDAASAGEVVLTDETGRTVRVPVTARPTRLGAPSTTALRGPSEQPSKALSVSTGYSGKFEAQSRGLGAPVSSTRTAQASTNNSNPALDTNAVRIPVDVPAATPAALQLETSGATAGSDLDVFLYARTGADTPTGGILASSAADGSNERARAVRLSGGAYVWVVSAYLAPAGGASFTVRQWNTAATSTAALAVSGPASPDVVAGDRFPISVTASGVGAPGPYVGLVAYYDSTAANRIPIDTTVVDVGQADPVATPVPPERTPDGCVPPKPPPVPDPEPGTPTGTVTTPAVTPPTETQPGVTTPPAAPAGPVSPTTPAGTLPVKTVAKAAPRLVAGKLTLRRGRTLTVQLSGVSEPVGVSVAVFKPKAKRAVITAARRAVTPKTKSVSFKLAKKLRRGTYRLVLTARTTDGRTRTVTKTLRVR